MDSHDQPDGAVLGDCKTDPCFLWIVKWRKSLIINTCALFVPTFCLYSLLFIEKQKRLPYLIVRPPWPDNNNNNNKRRTKMKEENKKPVSMKIDADVWRIFKACAVANGYKVAELVEKALIDEVKMMEEKNNA